MRVLVPYDSTSGAEAALRTAERIARETAGDLLLLRALNPHADAADIVAATTAEAMGILVRQEQASLDERVLRLGDVRATTQVLVMERDEDTGMALSRIADEWDADLVVIGSRRVAGLSGLLLGSVTSRLLHLSDRPVVVVKPNAPA